MFNERSALIPIDMQLGFDLPPIRPMSNLHLDQNALKLLAFWRQAKWPVLHVCHDSIYEGSTLHPNHPGNAMRDGFNPQADEPMIRKSVNCAFIGTDLELRLRRLNIDTVVLFGLYADMCVSTSARIASNLGFKTYVVADACASIDQQDIEGKTIAGEMILRANLATLNTEFANVISTQTVLAAKP
jgi:nicotinamidase-related amidase